MTNAEAFTHLDLFSGIGGFSIGFENAGFRTIGFAETDPFCAAVLKKHWPDVPNYGDVRTLPAVSCFVLTGGFPCQPFSIAGLRRGQKDDRNFWPAMRDAVQKCRPAWVVCENVPNLIPLALDDILVDLADLGYTAQSFVVPACAVGLAQIEGARLWVVAATDGQRCHSGNQISPLAATPLCQAKGKKRRWRLRDFRANSARIFRAPVSTFDRVDYGLPGELDRVKALGNSIAPEIAQIIGETIRNVSFL